jgi:hypothetical protein
MKKLYIIFLFFSFVSFSQEEEDLFPFREGIYMSVDELRGNSPSYENEELYISGDYYGVRFYYVNDLGTYQEIPGDILAYCIEKEIYIFYKGRINRVIHIGNIFTFLLSSNELSIDEPMNNIPPGKICFMDFKTGKIDKLTKENLIEILKRDEMLFREYNNLDKQGKTKKMVLFVNKYNERNPLLLSEN